MSGIDATDITVVRDGKAIISGVSLAMGYGQFVGLIGPNGAGKSTLMSVLSGLVEPELGSVSLDGRPMLKYPRRELARLRAFLPQTPRAEWPISVERLVALGLTPQLPAFGGLGSDLQNRVDHAIAMVDLEARRTQPATTLSGGELARAMLARAMVGDPAILMADEPLAGLDPRHALDSVGRLRGLADAGKLVVASIHDLTLAARYTTHIAVMRGGSLVAYGPTEETLNAELMEAVFDVAASVDHAGTPHAVVNFSSSTG